MIAEITREELKQKLDHPKKFVLLETLAPEDYRRSHLPGALNLPPDECARLAPGLIPGKDTEVIVYCAGPECHASENAARELSQMGYSKVRRYVGGKRDWMDAGLPVMSDEQPRAAA
jgi:rhodanese-related sulfurtransferase